MRCFKTEIEQMKIALIGYGKMGHAIEQIALQRGHEIVSVIDVNNQEDFTSDAFKSADVAIEFSMPAVAMDNYRRAFAAGVPVVSGTTGWLEHLPEIKEACKAGQTFFYASNFSLGVNIFFALNKYLAKLITWGEGLIDNIERKNKWVEGKEPAEDEIGICSVREGEVPGIHTVIYESDVDTISITHDAKSRMGFALGAVIAAEFTCGKKGFLTMQDMLKF